MNRRQFLSAGAVALVAPSATVYAGANFVNFNRAQYEQLLASGKPFMLDFYASW